MTKREKEKIRYLIWNKQQQYEHDASWCYEARAWYNGLQWALDEIEKLEITEENGNDNRNS